MRSIVLIGHLIVGVLLVPAIAAANATATVETVGQGCQYARLQDAIDAAGTTDPFEIHVLATYYGAPVSYANKWIEIIGGFPTCDAAAPLPFDGSNLDALSKIDGAQNPGHPAINVSGNSRLGLNNFQLLNATHPGANGGGISYNGSGDHSYLALKNVNIYNNSAERGGGVFFRGTATSSNVMLIDDNTWIYFNTASASGGGIRLEGNVVLTAIGVQSTISYNTAAQTSSDGAGGGIQLRDSTVANVGSPGVDGYAYIDHNFARVGGGVAVQNDATLNLYSSRAEQQGRIENNNAADSGGGVFVDPRDGIPTLCMVGGAISGNTAGSGAAIEVDPVDDDSHPAKVLIGANDTVCSEQGLPQFAACLPGRPCNTIDLNQNLLSNFSSSGIIDLYNKNTTASIRYLAMRGNAGGDAIFSNNGTEPIDVTSSILTNNNLTDDLVFSLNFGPVKFLGCSIGGNHIPAGNKIFNGYGPLELTNTVVWQPANTTMNRSSVVTLNNFISSDASHFNPASFAGFHNVLSADPKFIDAEGGDLHLNDNSPAIDAAATGTGTDLDLLPRGIDVAQGSSSPNLGPFDLGAYEVQYIANVPGDVIFASGFDGVANR